MKKFIISVLCVSVFFIGLGGLVEKTGAKFKSDAKALELINLARTAIGGEANIKNVRSMTITGKTDHILKTENTTDIKQGSVEINLEFSGKFSKMVRVGNPGDDADIRKDFDVIVMKKDSGTTDVKDSGDGRQVVIVKDGDGKVLTENIKPADGQRKIIIKKDDGTILTEDIKAGDGKTFTFERKSGDEPASWTTEDGKRIVVEKDVKLAGAMRQNELLQTTFALLLSTPDGTDAEYLYAGEGNIDGYPTDVVEVKSAGASFKLHLDKTSHLPRMLSYSALPEMKFVKLDKSAERAAPKEDVKVFVRNMKDAKTELVEHQVKFADFRYVGGIQLPHRWTKTVGGNPGETIEISNYEINPVNIADKFKDPKVFIRKSKAQ